MKKPNFFDITYFLATYAKVDEAKITLRDKAYHLDNDGEMADLYRIFDEFTKIEVKHNIQANWGNHLEPFGFVGIQPISESGETTRIAVNEYVENDGEQDYTVYDGFEVSTYVYDKNPTFWLKLFLTL